MTAGDLTVVAEASYRGHHTLVDQEAQRPFPGDSSPPCPPPPIFYSLSYTVPQAVAVWGGGGGRDRDCLD